MDIITRDRKIRIQTADCTEARHYQRQAGGWVVWNRTRDSWFWYLGFDRSEVYQDQDREAWIYIMDSSPAVMITNPRDNGTRYLAQAIEDGKDETDRSGIEACMGQRRSISMGSTVFQYIPGIHG